MSHQAPPTISTPHPPPRTVAGMGGCAEQQHIRGGSGGPEGRVADLHPLHSDQAGAQEGAGGQTEEQSPGKERSPLLQRLQEKSEGAVSLHPPRLLEAGTHECRLGSWKHILVLTLKTRVQTPGGGGLPLQPIAGAVNQCGKALHHPTPATLRPGPTQARGHALFPARDQHKALSPGSHTHTHIPCLSQNPVTPHERRPPAVPPTPGTAGVSGSPALQHTSRHCFMESCSLISYYPPTLGHLST